MRVLRHVGCAVLGVVVCLAAVTVHRSYPPWGLLLALAASFAVPGWLLGSSQVAVRRSAASYVAGWVALLVAVLPGRREGDYALASDLEGLALLATAFVMLGVGVVSLAAGRRRRP